MKPCCINFFIYKDPDKYTNNRQYYDSLFLKLKITPIKIIFYIPEHLKKQGDIKDMPDIAGINLYMPDNTELLFDKIYNESSKNGEGSIFIDDVTEYYINDSYNTSLKNVGYISHTDNNRHLYRLFYIDAGLGQADISNISEYMFNTRNIISGISSRIIIDDETCAAGGYNIKYTWDLCDNIYNSLICQNYKDIVTINSEADHISNWFINYAKAVSHYKLHNYAESIEFCNKCETITAGSPEVSYIIAHINYIDGNYTDSLIYIENYFKTLLPLEGYINNIEECTNNIHHMGMLILTELKKISPRIDLVEWMINNNVGDEGLFNYLNELLPIYANIQSSEKYLLKNKLLTYEHSEKHIIYNDNVFINTTSETHIEIKNINYKKHHIIEVLQPAKNGTCINYNDTSLLYVTSLNPELIINAIDLDKGVLTSFRKHPTDSHWSEYILMTNFVRLENVYMALVCHNKAPTNLFKIICLDNVTLEPISMSKFIRLDFTVINDIFVVDRELHIICGNNNNPIWYSLNITALYLNHNLPLNFKDNIIINSNKFKLQINLPTVGSIPDSLSRSYIINSNEPDYILNIDYDHGIFYKEGYNTVPLDFIYNYRDVNIVEKDHTLFFYDKHTANELYSGMTELGVSISDSYERAKYYIVDAHDMDKFSSNDISNIINNNTLIICLIEEYLEDEDEEQYYKYVDDDVLNKLFLFNIMKNSEYITFIYERIIEDDQYSRRLNFMKKDKKSINNNSGIARYIETVITNPNKYEELYKADYDKFPYKLSLITNLHKRTNNLILIEILRYILYNDQTVNIINNISLHDTVRQLNILGNILTVDYADTVNAPEKFLLILDSLETFNKLRHICNEESMIYINDLDKILFTV